MGKNWPHSPGDGWERHNPDCTQKIHPILRVKLEPGFVAHGHGMPWLKKSLSQDPDLSALAELRKPRFEALVQLSKSISF